uniref:Uncharacterized protein n=1 Tax=Arundo donax TaxID=35708 RepID=A0A0A9CI01_ARUDO
MLLFYPTFFSPYCISLKKIFILLHLHLVRWTE